MLAISFTGGHGCGKSTTLAALEARAYVSVPESARAIIPKTAAWSPTLRDPAGSYPETTGGTESADRLYVQNLHLHSIGWMAR